MRLTSSTLAALLCGVAVHACTVYERRDPAALPTALPDAFSRTVTGASQPQKWWSAFADADLSAQVDAVLDQNLDLKQGGCGAGRADWPGG